MEIDPSNVEGGVNIATGGNAHGCMLKPESGEGVDPKPYGPAYGAACVASKKGLYTGGAA